MNFPTTNKKVRFYKTLMAISIEEYSKMYVRIYYLVTYDDDTELIFMTTNKSEFGEKQNVLNFDFYLILDFDYLVNDFEIDCSSINTPPKYIYWDIISIDDSFKSKLLEHLEYGIAGYTELDYDEIEKVQIKKWLEYLKPNQHKYD